MISDRKIVHINLSDTFGGGSLAALRLHTAMLDAGYDSTLMVIDKRISDRDDIIDIKPSKAIWYSRAFVGKIFDAAMRPFTGKINTQRGAFDFIGGYRDILKFRELLDCDIIYLHCVFARCLSYGALKKILALNKKIYWFLHDNFAITGGCLHPFECEKYYERCGKCPCWEGTILFDRARYEFDHKNRIIGEADNLAFIAPSLWMADNASRSAIAKNKMRYHIPNMVEPKIYKVIDKNIARELFSIDSGKKIIGFGAVNAIKSRYKGWEYMKDALNILYGECKNNKDIEIIIFGCNYCKDVANSLPFKVHFLGYLSDEYSKAMMYNAMDVFVMPSLAENFPQTILESLACNVPVVAFDVGGIPDTVNEDTGYLAKYKDSADLAKGIDIILSRTEKKDVRQHVEKYFTGAILHKHIEMWDAAYEKYCGGKNENFI